MTEIKDIEHINNLESNFRSDVVAAGMVDSGIDADKIVILRRQGNVRQTDKEVIAVEFKHDYEGSDKDTWIIKANRQGMYDNLPEGLFHDFAGLKDNSKEAIIHSFRKQSIQEVFIRRFFSLYEAESERTRIDIQLAEYRYDRPDKHRAFVDTMSEFWPVIKEMDTCSAMLFIRTIPYISEIRNSYSQIAQAISLITGNLVRIERSYDQISQTNPVRLGNMKLGVNSVLRGQITIPSTKVIVTPNKENSTELIPGKKQHNVLQILLEIFLPMHVDSQLIITPKEQDYTSCLGDKDNPCILGVNLKLKSKKTTYESKE